MIKRVLFWCLILVNSNVFADLNPCLKTLWGIAPPNSLYLGMWTYHFNDANREIYNNELVMLVYRSFFFGTLVNCYDDRTYIFGIQRYMFENHIASCVDSRWGYRAGFIYGYDERLMPIAGKLKLLPCAQLIYDLGWKHMGVEVSFTGVVVSVGLSIHV